MIVTAVVLVSLCATALWWQLNRWELNQEPGLSFSEKIWAGISCRAGLYLRKAEGKIPELSWSEVWAMSQPRRGFDCNEGGSLEASIQFSSIASAEDRRAGARIFHERCSGCHGNDGSGGSVGPSLTRSRYDHGDSDLAVYLVVRDGVPGTAMPRAHLSLPELVQVTAHVKALQAQLLDDQEPSRPAIIVSIQKPVDKKIRTRFEQLVRAVVCRHQPPAAVLIAPISCGPTARITSAAPTPIGRPA